MEAILFVGIQGAGKSSFFRERFFDTHVRINLDMLRSRRREEILLNACCEVASPSWWIIPIHFRGTGNDIWGPRKPQGFRIIAYFFDPRCATPYGGTMRARQAKNPGSGGCRDFKKIVHPP